MRDRKTIETDPENPVPFRSLEVLLDIRDLLVETVREAKAEVERPVAGFAG